MPLTIRFEPEASEADRLVVENSLNEFNMRVMNDRNYMPINFLLRDASGIIRGGLLGGVWGGWMHLNFLWIDESLRGQGYGHQLHEAAETLVRSQDCRGMYLETHSFQGKGFYEKHGYTVVGEIEEYPPGHSYYLMKKRFA